MRIKTGDKVKVIRGKDRGKTGKVLQVFPSRNRVAVEGINVLKKHARSSKAGEKGQRIEFPNPMDASNAMVVCPKCSKPARIGSKRLESGKRARMCKKCGEIVD